MTTGFLAPYCLVVEEDMHLRLRLFPTLKSVEKVILLSSEGIVYEFHSKDVTVFRGCF